MPRTKDARKVRAEVCQSIYDMSSVGFKDVDIAKYYNIRKCIISNILKCMRKRSKTAVKKTRKKLKLSARDIRLFQRYVFEGCYKALLVTVVRFK